MNLLITGITGFLGRHLLNKLSIERKHNIYFTNRAIDEIFPNVPQQIDWVIHLAASHRAESEKDVYLNNNKINTSLVDLLNKHQLKPNILFTSSIHEDKNTYYGLSKREGAAYFKKFCKERNTSFEKIIFPNIFGSHAKPNHTSVVATFCKNIVDNETSYVNDVSINLLYVDEAIKAILNLKSVSEFELVSIALPDLYEMIQEMHNNYIENNIKVNINSTFKAHLFITLTSYY